MQLNPLHLKVANLLDGRLFRIPEYQRAYSWGHRQREDLFKDIREANRSSRDHFMATLVALARDVREIGVDEFKTVELVDGQQRVTTLVILLKAIHKSLDLTDSREEKVRRELGELLVKGDDHSLILLQTNHDSSNVFVNYIRKGIIDRDSAITAADRNLVEAAFDCEKFVQRCKEDGMGALQLVSTIRNRLTIIYHELDDEATVYRVFEVLNSRGLSVKWIDKLKSQLMGLIFEHFHGGTRNEAVQEMQVIWQNIYRALENDTKIGDEALRFAGTWAAPTRLNRIASEEDSMTHLAGAAGIQLKSITAIGHQLEAVVQASLKLFQNPRLRAVTRISHARFVASAILLRRMNPDDELELLNKWERATFRIFELGGADTRHKVGDYVRLGYDIYRSNLDKAEIIMRLDEISRGFSIDEVLEEIDWGDCYFNWAEQLRYLLYRYDEHLCKKAGQFINTNQWEKIWAHDASSSIEHIQPQSSGFDYIHNVGNLTMLPPGVNSSLNDDLPTLKASSYQSCGMIGTINVGRNVEEKKKWTREMVLDRMNEIEAFVREEWAN